MPSTRGWSSVVRLVAWLPGCLVAWLRRYAQLNKQRATIELNEGDDYDEVDIRVKC